MSYTAIKSRPVETQSAVDLIKARMKATWEDGDYATFATYMQAGAVEVMDHWNIKAGQRLLDVACGAGQTAIPAARKGAQVTGIDIAANLIGHARKRSHEEGLNACFEVGDAEDIPCPNAGFDVAVSMFGAMFAPRPEVVVGELARVLRPGGRLIMANWTSDSMPAQMFKAVAAVVPPPAGAIPPLLWGDEATVMERLVNDFTNIQLIRRIYPQWHYPFGVRELVEFFARYFGPVKRAFDVADPRQRLTLRKQLADIYARNSEVYNDTLKITGGEFLEVIAVRR